MERLTIKKDDGRYYINQLSIDNSYSAGVNCLYGKPIDKLAEFEDFMEEMGFDNLAELKELLMVNDELVKLVAGLDANYICKCLLEYPTFQQENQALKDRWENLREFVYCERICVDDGFQEVYDAYGCVLDKMQELENRQ